MPCRFASCAGCYEDAGVIPFPVNRAFNDESMYYARRREDSSKYMIARRGEWAIAPFQCENCWFVNLHHRVPLTDSMRDQNLLHTLRRANLDIFWSREYKTIQTVTGHIREIIRRAKEADRPVPLDPLPPWPVRDDQGMGIAIMMLEKSVEPGRNTSKYSQFDTVRKLRSAAFNVFAASSTGSASRYAVKSSKDQKLSHLFTGSTQSLLMENFTSGMKARMPQKTVRNKALVSEVIGPMLDRMEAELEDVETDAERKRELTMAGGYIVATFGYSLRGNEGFWLDGDRLVSGLQVGKYAQDIPHIVISLLGKFKGEDGDRMHVLPLANVTKSGIRIRKWLERVARIYREEGRSDSPAFCDKEGYMLTSGDIERVFHPFLIEMQGEERFGEYLPRGLKVEEHYLCFRSFRRGAEATALNRGIKKPVIDFVHRWSKYERSKGKVPGFNMLEHYAEGARMRPTQLTFSRCL